jgi:hypothetical protein
VSGNRAARPLSYDSSDDRLSRSQRCETSFLESSPVAASTAMTWSCFSHRPREPRINAPKTCNSKATLAVFVGQKQQHRPHVLHGKIGIRIPAPGARYQSYCLHLRQNSSSHRFCQQERVCPSFQQQLRRNITLGGLYSRLRA